MDLKKYPRKNNSQEVMELKFDAFKKMLNFELMELQSSIRGELAKAFSESSSTSKKLSLAQITQQDDENSVKVSEDDTENSGTGVNKDLPGTSIALLATGGAIGAAAAITAVESSDDTSSTDTSTDTDDDANDDNDVKYLTDDTDEVNDNHLIDDTNHDDENHLSDEANVIYDDTEPTDVLLNLDDNVDIDDTDDIEPVTDLIVDTDLTNLTNEKPI